MAENLKEIGLESVGKGLYLFEAKAPTKPESITFKINNAYKVLSFGHANNFPQELIRAINNSPTARACTKSHAKFLAGDGFVFSQDTPFSSYLKTIFTNDLLRRLAYDYTYFEAVSLKLRFDLNAKVTGIHHIDDSTVRLGEINPENGNIEFAKMSTDWENVRKKENTPVDIELYDPIKIKQRISSFAEKPDEFQKWEGALLYAKRYAPGQPYYAIPSWSSALQWVYVDGEIQKFHANNIDNAFMPSVLMFFPYEPKGTTPDGRDKKTALKEDFKEATSGADKGGEPFIIYGPNKEAAPQVTQFNANSNHELFIALSDIITKHTVRAFQIPQFLAGIETPGSLGSTNEILNSWDLYQNTVVKDDQNFLTEIFNDLAKQMPNYDGTEVTISNNLPIRYISDQVLQYLDPAVIIKYYGFDPLTDLKKGAVDGTVL
jgi:hypothetical protein